jgi:hypothetical protein
MYPVAVRCTLSDVLHIYPVAVNGDPTCRVRIYAHLVESGAILMTHLCAPGSIGAIYRRTDAHRH